MKKRFTAIAAIAAVAVLAGGCATSASVVSSEAMKADPWVELKTLEEAEESVGLELVVPDMSEYGSEEVYRVCEALTELEIQYYDGDDLAAYIRKAEDNGDISGDYQEYAYSEEIEAGDKTAEIKGDSEDSVKLAIWHDGDMAFCIGVTNGVSVDTMSKLISGVE